MPASSTLVLVIASNRAAIHAIIDEAEFALVIANPAQDLINDIVDLTTGRTPAALAAIAQQTEADLAAALHAATLTNTK